MGRIAEGERHLRVLARLGLEIARVMQRHELCRAIVTLLREELGYDQIGLWLYDEGRGALVLNASEGFAPGFDRGLIPIDRGINGWAFRHMSVRLAPVAQADPEFWEGPPDCASVLAVPLVSHGQALGTLDVESRTAGTLGEEDAALLGAVAPAIAAAIEVSVLHERLRDAALSDGLTGLANFRGFSHTLAREAARSRRYGEIFSVALLDVDGLKSINDAQGHLAGDEALREVAEALRSMLRATDILARYGGDEFAIILPQTTLEQAVASMTRVQQWCHTPVSFGVAQFPKDAADPSGLLAAADRHLYLAKRGKRKS